MAVSGSRGIGQLSPIKTHFRISPSLLAVPLAMPVAPAAAGSPVVDTPETRASFGSSMTSPSFNEHKTGARGYGPPSAGGTPEAADSSTSRFVASDQDASHTVFDFHAAHAGCQPGTPAPAPGAASAGEEAASYSGDDLHTNPMFDATSRFGFCYARSPTPGDSDMNNAVRRLGPLATPICHLNPAFDDPTPSPKGTGAAAVAAAHQPAGDLDDDGIGEGC